MPQQGAYSPNELQWVIEYNGLVLAEVESVNYDFSPNTAPAGAGLGSLKNTYYKPSGPAKGTWSISRSFLQRADGGYLFLDLCAGDKYIVQEAIASGASTYTLSLTNFIGIMEIRLLTSNLILREGVDYTIAYTTGVITFIAALPENAVVRYLSPSRKNQNLLVNGGFEDLLGSVWAASAGGTIARTNTAANVYAETWALAMTPAAQNDGVKHALAVQTYPGRTYRLRFRAKGTAGNTLAATWNDGSSDIAMTPATITLTASWAVYEFTFTATKAAAANIILKNTTSSTFAVFYLDEVALMDDTYTSTNPMDAGLGQPFTFNLIARRIADGYYVKKLIKCAVDSTGFKGATKGNYGESIKGQFLDYQGE
jgi:hypothetical protein